MAILRQSILASLAVITGSSEVVEALGGCGDVDAAGDGIA